MKKLILCLIAVLSVFFSACSNLAFTQGQRGRVAAFVLYDIYNNGGAEVVIAEIDALVEKGKITQEQGEHIKESAQMAFDALVERVSKSE